MRQGWKNLFDDDKGDLLAILEASVHDDLRKLHALLQRNDVMRIEFVAHRLKGSARLIDDALAIALCEQLEAAGRASDLQRAEVLLTAVELRFTDELRARRLP